MKALVIGAEGFIGTNLVKRLTVEGWEVHGLDLKSGSDASIGPISINYDRIYQLAADMGGAGFVFTGDNDADILTNSLSINLNVLGQLKDFKGKVFFSSSVCVYPAEGTEAYPANPPSNYGWEKLTSERLYAAYAKNYGLDVRIARFHNTYGPYGVYEGGREKAPAALCRKVILADKEIEIWGDGTQVRPFIFISDLLDGIEALMNSDITEPTVLGPETGVTINEMVDLLCQIAGKDLEKVYVPGPTGEHHRLPNSAHFWTPKTSLADGLKITYDWIKGEIDGV